MLHQIKAQQFYTDSGLYQQKIVEFKDFSRLLSDLSLFNFQGLQESPLNSSTFQACENPGLKNRQNKRIRQQIDMPRRNYEIFSLKLSQFKSNNSCISKNILMSIPGA